MRQERNYTNQVLAEIKKHLPLEDDAYVINIDNLAELVKRGILAIPIHIEGTKKGEKIKKEIFFGKKWKNEIKKLKIAYETDDVVQIYDILKENTYVLKEKVENKTGRPKTIIPNGVAIFTGKINNITVIDIDNPKQFEKTTSIPIEYLLSNYAWIRTPNGGYHVYIEYEPTLSTTTNGEFGFDIRNDDALVIAPSSKIFIGKDKIGLPLEEKQYEFGYNLVIRKIDIETLTKLKEFTKAKKGLDIIQKEKETKNEKSEKREKKLKEEEKETIINLLKEIWEEGHRNKIELHFLGELYRNGIDIEEAREIIERIIEETGDEETKHRLYLVNYIYGKYRIFEEEGRYEKIAGLKSLIEEFVRKVSLLEPKTEEEEEIKKKLTKAVKNLSQIRTILRGEKRNWIFIPKKIKNNNIEIGILLDKKEKKTAIAVVNWNSENPVKEKDYIIKAVIKPEETEIYYDAVAKNYVYNTVWETIEQGRVRTYKLRGTAKEIERDLRGLDLFYEKNPRWEIVETILSYIKDSYTKEIKETIKSATGAIFITEKGTLETEGLFEEIEKEYNRLPREEKIKHLENIIGWLKRLIEFETKFQKRETLLAMINWVLSAPFAFAKKQLTLISKEGEGFFKYLQIVGESRTGKTTLMKLLIETLIGKNTEKSPDAFGSMFKLKTTFEEGTIPILVNEGRNLFEQKWSKEIFKSAYEIIEVGETGTKSGRKIKHKALITLVLTNNEDVLTDNALRRRFTTLTFSTKAPTEQELEEFERIKKESVKYRKILLGAFIEIVKENLDILKNSLMEWDFVNKVWDILGEKYGLDTSNLKLDPENWKLEELSDLEASKEEKLENFTSYILKRLKDQKGRPLVRKENLLNRMKNELSLLEELEENLAMYEENDRTIKELKQRLQEEKRKIEEIIGAETEIPIAVVYKKELTDRLIELGYEAGITYKPIKDKKNQVFREYLIIKRKFLRDYNRENEDLLIANLQVLSELLKEFGIKNEYKRTSKGWELRIPLQEFKKLLALLDIYLVGSEEEIPIQALIDINILEEGLQALTAKLANEAERNEVAKKVLELIDYLQRIVFTEDITEKLEDAISFLEVAEIALKGS